MAIDLRTEGTLVVALTADDRARLQHDVAFQQQLGLSLEWLSAGRNAAARAASVAGLAGAVFSPQDHQVDNRKLAAALRVAAERAGAVIREHAPVDRIAVEGGRATGVVIAGELHRADIVVLAAGAWSRSIEGLPSMRARRSGRSRARCWRCAWMPRAPLLRHVVWAPDVYLVPRHDGRLLVGATVEEKGFDPHLTAGGAARAAQRRVARAARHRGTADRGKLGRFPAGQPRRRADPGRRAGRRASSMRPAITATASC